MSIKTRKTAMSLALAFAMSALATPASAFCYLCDDVIVLNRDNAACFIDRFDALSSAIEAADDGWAEFNLEECIDPDAERDRGGLSLMPTLGQTAAAGKRKKMRYTLDAEGAACLKVLLKAYDGPFDPNATFDLVQTCNP